jgi:ribose transport system substrate-binding protein
VFLTRKIGAVCAVAVVGVTACGGSSSTSSSSGGGGGSGGGGKVLGIVESSGSDITTTEFAGSAKKAAEAAGWTVLIVDSQSKVDTANSAMVTFAQRPVTAIIVTVFASSSLRQGITAAQAAHIPVLSFAGGSAPGVAAAMVANEGDVVANRLVKDLGGGAAGSVLEFTYHPGLPCFLRGQSSDNVLFNYPNINVTRHEIDVQNAASDGLNTSSAWLATHPTAPLAIFGCYDDPALGAIATLKQAGYKPGDVKIYGFNNAANAQTAIQQGWMTASMWYDVVGAGPTMFKTLQQVIAAGSSWKPKTIAIPHQLVDGSNLAAWQAQHPNGV